MNPNISTCKRFSGFTVNKLIPTFGAIKLAKIHIQKLRLQKICLHKNAYKKYAHKKYAYRKYTYKKYAHKNTLTKIRLHKNAHKNMLSLLLSFLPMVTSHLKINRCPHPGQVAFDKQVGKVSQTNCLYELIKEFGTPHKKDVHNHGALT